MRTVLRSRPVGVLLRHASVLVINAHVPEVARCAACARPFACARPVVSPPGAARLAGRRSDCGPARRVQCGVEPRRAAHARGAEDGPNPSKFLSPLAIDELPLRRIKCLNRVRRQAQRPGGWSWLLCRCALGWHVVAATVRHARVLRARCMRRRGRSIKCSSTTKGCCSCARVACRRSRTPTTRSVQCRSPWSCVRRCRSCLVAPARAARPAPPCLALPCLASAALAM
jgi:hypothetical protein